MTDSIVDNNRNVPITPLSEFVDSVFAELSSHSNEWNEYLEGYGYFDNPDCWKNTLIPLAIRLYELAQTDDMVYWWLLQLMSSIDVCKDGELDLRKRKVFEILSKLDPKHSSFILGKSVPEHYNELHEALRTNALDVFRNYLTIEEENSILYNIYRVLKRIEDIRNIYEETMSYSKGDALGKLFLLFKRYYRYFAEAYKNTQRSCDGMAKNVFLALYQTQFRHNKNDFCDVADIIGGLWERSLMLTYIKDKDQMPLSVSNIMYNVFQEGGDAEVFKSLDEGFRDRINEKRREAFVNAKGGWLEFEKYGFIWEYVLDNEWKKTLPPFSCRCLNKRRSVRIPVQRNGNMERRNVQDNCSPYIDSKNAIPMEELLKLRKDVPRLFELENKANHFNGCVDEGSQVVIEETLNEKARRLIGDLLPELKDHLNPRYKTEKLEKFFDDILISKDRPINEQVAQETIVKKLFNNRSKYEYQGLKVIVFCRIIGYLLSEKVSVLTGEPKPIAEKLQPFLTKTNVQNGKDPKSVENLRSYIDKAKTGITKPPGKSLIDKVLGLKES